MRLKWWGSGSQDASNRRRRRQVTDDSPPQRSTGLAYRARRSEEELNIGRRPEQQGTASDTTMSFARFWLQRFGMIVLLIAVVASAINVLTLSVPAEILPLSAPLNTLHSTTAYQASVNRLMASSFWDHNKITVDTDQISRQLLVEFPEISSASVTIPLLSHHPIVYIQLAQPALIIQSGSHGSFILDSNGKALLPDTSSALVPNQSQLPVVTDLSGLTLQLGRQVLPATTVSFVQTVVGQLAAKHYTVTTMTLPPAASELDVMVAGQPYKIKFNLESNDPRQQVGTFLATISELQSQNITPAQYVDVRVDGRAYYQ